jgi:NhaP-type Na+/H+ or K+/H+ antiporter
MLLLAFALILYIAVLLSGTAEHSILSTAVLFLIGGLVLGQSMLGLVVVQPQEPLVAQFTELALFSVLFTDGMRFDLHEIKAVWRLPGRALLYGMPITIAGTALLARYLVGLPWLQALLVGAVLSPTDPVFASAIVKRAEVPSRLRRLLNVESGLNDGLALPAVVVLLNLLGTGQRDVWTTLGELALGIGIGIGVPWLGVMIGRGKFLPPAGVYRPLNAFAIGLLVLATARLLHGNLFLAAFSSGVTVVTICPKVRDAFGDFGESISELLKLVVLLMFGALIALPVVLSFSWRAYIFAVLAIVAVRPLAIELAMLWSSVPWRERLVAAWFGPKGFASIFYGVLILREGVPDGSQLFHLIALVIALSIVAHSSTDVIAARWLAATQSEPGATPNHEVAPR